MERVDESGQFYLPRNKSVRKIIFPDSNYFFFFLKEYYLGKFRQIPNFSMFHPLFQCDLKMLIATPHPRGDYVSGRTLTYCSLYPPVWGRGEPVAITLLLCLFKA